MTSLLCIVYIFGAYVEDLWSWLGIKKPMIRRSKVPGNCPEVVHDEFKTSSFLGFLAHELPQDAAPRSHENPWSLCSIAVGLSKLSTFFLVLLYACDCSWLECLFVLDYKQHRHPESEKPSLQGHHQFHRQVHNHGQLSVSPRCLGQVNKSNAV